MKLIALLLITVLSSTVAQCQSSAELMNIGNAHFLIGNYTSALPYFTKATQCITTSPKANYMTALCHYNLKNYTVANTYFTNELSIDSNCAQAYYFKSYIANNNIDSALHYISKAINLQPHKVAYLITKADIYYNHKQYPQAIIEYNNVLLINKKQDYALYKLGYCNYYVGNVIAACLHWSKISELDDFENETFITELINNTRNKK